MNRLNYLWVAPRSSFSTRLALRFGPDPWKHWRRAATQSRDGAAFAKKCGRPHIQKDLCDCVRSEAGGDTPYSHKQSRRRGNCT